MKRRCLHVSILLIIAVIGLVVGIAKASGSALIIVCITFCLAVLAMLWWLHKGYGVSKTYARIEHGIDGRSSLLPSPSGGFTEDELIHMGRMHDPWRRAAAEAFLADPDRGSMSFPDWVARNWLNQAPSTPCVPNRPAASQLPTDCRQRLGAQAVQSDHPYDRH